jgi:hypothetical protein
MAQHTVSPNPTFYSYHNGCWWLNAKANNRLQGVLLDSCVPDAEGSRSSAVSMRSARGQGVPYYEAQLIGDVPESISAIACFTQARCSSGSGGFGAKFSRIISLSFGAVHMRLDVARVAAHFLLEPGSSEGIFKLHPLSVLDESIGHGDAGLGNLERLEQCD